MTHPPSFARSACLARPRRLAAGVAAAVLLAGCASRVPLYSDDQPPGLDRQGRVLDSSQVQRGWGRTVQGLDGWQGEIVGEPAPGSAFSRLQIGMSIEQARALLGAPSYQGAYVTGKVWIPFFFGSDRHRFELVYAGQGRLLFAGGTLTDPSRSNLIMVVHNANESARP